MQIDPNTGIRTQAMPERHGYAISTTHRQRKSYWQTPWATRVRQLDAEGKPEFTNEGRAIFQHGDDGEILWKEIGGAVSRIEWATVYPTREEAEMVNAIRDLCGEVVAV